MFKKGIIVVNLGTPTELTHDALFRYLNEFLMDWRVIDLPRFFWAPFLRYFILPRRVPKVLENYKEIWEHREDISGRKGGASPLTIHTRKIAEGMKKDPRISSHFIDVLPAMTYAGSDDPEEDAPFLSIQGAIKKMCDACQNDELELTVLSLYPHYSTSTVQPVEDGILRAIKNLSNADVLPKKLTVRLILHYYSNQKWINAIAESIKKCMQKNGLHHENTRILISYHGIPANYVYNRGDPYPRHCFKTTWLLGRALNIPAMNLSEAEIDEALQCEVHPDFNIFPKRYLIHAFQSQFGKAEWLKPATDLMLHKLGAQAEGTQTNLVCVCPGFAVDCLETIDEIAHEGAEEYLGAAKEARHHNKKIYFVECLNSSDTHINTLIDVVLNSEHYKTISYNYGESVPEIDWSYPLSENI